MRFLQVIAILVYHIHFLQQLYCFPYKSQLSFLNVKSVFNKNYLHHHRHKVIIKQNIFELNSYPSQLTKEIFEKSSQLESSGGAGGSSSLKGLINLETTWQGLKSGDWKKPPKQIVYDKSADDLMATSDYSQSTSAMDYDIIICGGTLGIFYAVAMQQLGYKVSIIERGKVIGRTQEWNISRKELNALIKLGILHEKEIESIIGIEFNPVRVGFNSDTSVGATRNNDGYNVYFRDVLNLGIKPDLLIEMVKRKFIDLGGTIFEDSMLVNITIHPSVAEVVYNRSSADISTGPSSHQLSTIRSRLVLDAMGNGSPISKQIRGSSEPDGVCIVVGTCASGYDISNNTYSDLIYTDTPLTRKTSSQLQYFWEAFPTSSGKSDRTTYLFTYMDAKPQRPSIMEIFDDYWELLPRYQGKSLQELEVLRILYGMFPTYRNSPIQSTYNRILQVGDASGIQSPLSFGGFGSLTRHLHRIVYSLQEALESDLLSANDLSRINSYQPNLSACWMFQRAMSVSINRDAASINDKIVLNTLSNSFSAMEKLGDATMRPFLQDVLMFGPLLRTLLLAAKQDPLTPLKIIPHVGIIAMVDFIKHFITLGIYTFLSVYISESLLTIVNNNNVVSGLISKQTKYRVKRATDAWKFGSGLDYYDEE